jgi:hypothetical protein
MTDSLIPDWIRQIKQSEDEATEATRSASKDAALAANVIQAKGPAFWRELLKELQITVDSLPAINLRATMSTISAKPEAVQVQITRESVFPMQLYINLFYDSPGAAVIRCVPQDENAYTLQFGVTGSDTLVLHGVGHGPMSPAEAAAAIIQPIVSRVRRKS